MGERNRMWADLSDLPHGREAGIFEKIGGLQKVVFDLSFCSQGYSR